VTITQSVFGALLVVGLLALAGGYGWSQWRLLRRLRAPGRPGGEDDRYLRGQARRRLATSVLLLVLAGLLAVALACLEGPAQRLADQAPGAAPTPEQRQFFHFYGAYWIVFLLVLLAVVALAGIDLWAIRRYGARQFRRLQDDRRAMLERQAALLRQQWLERN
jgi:hypothetical protein